MLGMTRQAVKKMISKNAIGVGQTWQDVTDSISANVTYVNDTEKPIQICNYYSNTSVFAYFTYIDGLPVARNSARESAYTNYSLQYSTSAIIVPAGSTYMFERVGVVHELR